MAYGLPARGQQNWDDELNNSIEALRADVESSVSKADVAASDAAYARNRADEVHTAVVGGTDAAVSGFINDDTSATKVALNNTYGRGVSVAAGLAAGQTFAQAFATATQAVNAGFSDAVFIPAGSYTVSAPLTLPKGRIHGAGIRSTVITVTGGGNGFQYHGPAGASNPRRIEVANLTITSAAATGTGISIFSAALVDLQRVEVEGFAHGIVLGAITHGDIDKCTVTAFAQTGVWIPNGEDYLPGYPSVSPPQNNRLTVQRCNIRSEVAGAVGVCDDGGWNHEVSRNSFEGCTTQLRVAGVEAFLAVNNEYESANTGPFIVLDNKSRAGTAVGSCISVTLGDSVCDAPFDQTVLSVAGAVLQLHLTQFNVHTTAGVAAFAGLGSVEKLHMVLCRNWGAGPLTDGSRATVLHYAPNISKSDLNLMGGKLTSDGASGSDTVQLDLGNGTLAGGVAAYGVGRGNTSARGTLDIRGGAADATAHGIRMLVNGSLALEVLGNAAGSQVKFSEARDLVFGTTTGTKIGTSAGQKIAFYGVTPRTQPGAYSISNPTALRALDGSATSPNTLGEVIQVLGRLITDLKSVGIIG